eukprot:5227433-Amphidinium_carterae.1
MQQVMARTFVDRVFGLFGMSLAFLRQQGMRPQQALGRPTGPRAPTAGAPATPKVVLHMWCHCMCPSSATKGQIPKSGGNCTKWTGACP